MRRGQAAATFIVSQTHLAMVTVGWSLDEMPTKGSVFIGEASPQPHPAGTLDRARLTI